MYYTAGQKNKGPTRIREEGYYTVGQENKDPSRIMEEG